MLGHCPGRVCGKIHILFKKLLYYCYRVEIENLFQRMVMTQDISNNAFVKYCEQTFKLTSLCPFVTNLLKARKDDLRSAVRQSSLQSMYWLSKTIGGGAIKNKWAMAQ